jgi:hypothetical protein
MQRAGAPPRPGIGILLGGLLLTGIGVASLLVILASGTYDTVGLVVVAPILLLVSLPALSRRARLEGDRRLFWLLVAALAIKLCGALARYYMTFEVYGGAADSASYHEFGVSIAENFRAGHFDTGLSSLLETDFIRFLTGLIYTFTGPTALGGFVVFSWLAFWGLYFFYRAFLIAVPEGRGRTYALLVFFLPSLIFWPSSIGKESWMIFTLGIASFGVARALSGRTWRGLLIVAIGTGLGSVVRPHVAGIMALAMVAAYLVRPTRKQVGSVTTMGKVVGFAAAAALAFLLVKRTDAFLESSYIETGGGVAAVLQQTTARTSVGESKFEPSILESPARAPFAVVTVLYRPFIWESHNPQVLLAGLEGGFLLLLTLLRLGWVASAARSLRRQPYVAFAIVYVGLFILSFSGFANFGLLARERTQLLPLFLVLLAVPPRVRQHADIED